MPELFMLLVYILVTIVLVAVILWGVDHMPYLDGKMKELFRVVIIVATVIWLIYLLFGFILGFSPAVLPHYRK